jgi:hydrogenase maturation protease
MRHSSATSDEFRWNSPFKAEGATIVIIGCGDPERRDDGVATEVMSHLAQFAKAGEWSHVRLVDAGAEGLSAMALARGAGSLILVDVNADVSPNGGQSIQPDAAEGFSPQTNFHSSSCRWEQALHAIQIISGVDFPKDVLVVLVEAAQAEFRRASSGASAVEKAIERIVGRVEAARQQGRYQEMAAWF